jgi:hypothetical protein
MSARALFVGIVLLGAVALAGGCVEVVVRTTEPMPYFTDTVERAMTWEAFEPQLVRELAKARVAEGTLDSLLRDFIGEYVSAGAEWEGRFSLRPDMTYTFVRTEPSGAKHRREGELFGAGNSVWFDEQGPGSAALLPVLWGERRYLVEANALGRFCAPDSGEPRSTIKGYFYLRDGDWSRPAEGVPVLLDGTPACQQVHGRSSKRP